MAAKVSDLYTFPVKGAQGQWAEQLLIDMTVGVKGDRIVALRKTWGDHHEWAKKANFFVCMNTPQMAAEVPLFDGSTRGKHGYNRLNIEYLTKLKRSLGGDENFAAQETDGTYSLHDTKGAYVSMLNIASVRELGLEMKQEINPLRFRMNIWLEGLDPFEELSWVDKYPGTREISIGHARFRVDDACERCPAINASPVNGRTDLDVLRPLRAMMEKRGYTSPHRGVPQVMGILAAPLHAGLIRPGDELRVH